MFCCFTDAWWTGAVLKSTGDRLLIVGAPQHSLGPSSSSSSSSPKLIERNTTVQSVGAVYGFNLTALLSTSTSTSSFSSFHQQLRDGDPPLTAKESFRLVGVQSYQKCGEALAVGPYRQTQNALVCVDGIACAYFFVQVCCVALCCLCVSV